MSEFWRKLRFLFGRGQFDQELEEEMRFHLEMAAEEQSATSARRAFGNVLNMKEASREMWTFQWLENLMRDLRYGGRVLRRNPGFAAVAIGTLALGIGANTAVFSVVDAVLLRPLPYPEPERLGAIAHYWRQQGEQGVETSQDGRTWELLRDHATYFDCAVFADWPTQVNFAAHGRVRYVAQQRVGAGFFRVLGVKPLYGREFTRDEDREGGPAIAVLSHGLWKSALNGDESVLQNTVMLRGAAYTVVGIMPPSFRTNTMADVWTPLRASTSGEGGGANYGIAIRLRPGVAWAQAESQVNVIGAVRVKEWEKEIPAGASTWLGLVPLQRYLSEETEKPLVILWIAAGTVLLIGCVNLAGLLVAKGAGRTREIATRVALGGGRAIVFRQLLAESLLLAALGGIAGVGVGYVGMRGLEFLARDSFNLWQTVQLDVRVLLATGLVTLLACVLIGVYPAWQATRTDIHTALAEGGGRSVAGGRSRWPRQVLVVAEVMLSVALLTGAGLLLRTFVYLRGLAPGLDSSGVVTATLSLQDARYQTSDEVNRLFDMTLERMHEMPGVEAAAVGLSLPYERGLNSGIKLPGGKFEMSVFDYVTPEYFRALRIPLLRGRVFTAADGPRAGKVIIVNATFANKYLGRKNPVGMHVNEGRESLEIVGLVGDVPVKGSLMGYAPLAAMPVIFMPAAQASDSLVRLVHVWFAPSWVVRTSAPARDAISGMQRAMESVEPLLPFSSFRDLGEVKSKTLGEQRLQATLMATMAALALLLAAIGIYGLIAHSVVERTRELGIRMAMGATTGQAISLVTLPGVALAAVGCALGCLLGWSAVDLMRHLIWGISPTDGATYIGVAGIFLTVAAAASLLPAWRITRLNPAITLRHE